MIRPRLSPTGSTFSEQNAFDANTTSATLHSARAGGKISWPKLSYEIDTCTVVAPCSRGVFSPNHTTRTYHYSHLPRVYGVRGLTRAGALAGLRGTRLLLGTSVTLATLTRCSPNAWNTSALPWPMEGTALPLWLRRLVSTWLGSLWSLSVNRLMQLVCYIS